MTLSPFFRHLVAPHHRRIQTYEVMGQCAVCLDLFSVMITETYDERQVQETARLKCFGHAQSPRLIHRPGVCDGKVTLYGSLPEH